MRRIRATDRGGFVTGHEQPATVVEHPADIHLANWRFQITSRQSSFVVFRTDRATGCSSLHPRFRFLTRSARRMSQTVQWIRPRKFLAQQVDSCSIWEKQFRTKDAKIVCYPVWVKERWLVRVATLRLHKAEPNTFTIFFHCRPNRL